jgi:hypothetical protein
MCVDFTLNLYLLAFYCHVPILNVSSGSCFFFITREQLSAACRRWADSLRQSIRSVTILPGTIPSRHQGRAQQSGWRIHLVAREWPFSFPGKRPFPGDHCPDGDHRRVDTTPIVHESQRGQDIRLGCEPPVPRQGVLPIQC